MPRRLPKSIPLRPDKTFRDGGALVTAPTMGIVLEFAVQPGVGAVAGITAGVVWMGIGIRTQQKQ